jgi:hypothetical protein
VILNLIKEGLGVNVVINFVSKVLTLLRVHIYAEVIIMKLVEAQHYSMYIQREVPFLRVKLKNEKLEYIN